MSAAAEKRVAPPDPAALERRAFAARLQEIEGNPLTSDDIALFALFDRRGLTGDERRAYIIAEAKKLAAG